MRILQIGSTGTVGSAVAAALRARGHDVIAADHPGPGSPEPALAVDLTDPASVAQVWQAVGRVDAAVSTVGLLELAPLSRLTTAQVEASLRGKLLSQVDLVLQGLPYVATPGSFTLVSGIMSRIPWAGGVTAAAANGGVEAFVRAVAAELGDGRRINAVSPGIVQESIDSLGGDNPLPGHEPVPAARVAAAYVRSVEGIESGTTFRVGH
ncbi:MAG TPA: short chain dehydrogenase [Cellulomonas sp.]